MRSALANLSKSLLVIQAERILAIFTKRRAPLEPEGFVQAHGRLFVDPGFQSQDGSAALLGVFREMTQKRGGRITFIALEDSKREERWQEGRSPYGLPKVRVVKVVTRKAKKAK